MKKIIGIVALIIICLLTVVSCSQPAKESTITFSSLIDDFSAFEPINLQVFLEKYSLMENDIERISENHSLYRIKTLQKLYGYDMEIILDLSEDDEIYQFYYEYAVVKSEEVIDIIKEVSQGFVDEFKHLYVDEQDEYNTFNYISEGLINPAEAPYEWFEVIAYDEQSNVELWLLKNAKDQYVIQVRYRSNKVGIQ